MQIYLTLTPLPTPSLPQIIETQKFAALLVTVMSWKNQESWEIRQWMINWCTYQFDDKQRIQIDKCILSFWADE